MKIILYAVLLGVSLINTTLLARPYERSFAWAPPLQPERRLDVVFHELRALDPTETGKDIAFCFRAPHATQGTQQYCFSEAEVENFAKLDEGYDSLDSPLAVVAWEIARGVSVYSTITYLTSSVILSGHNNPLNRLPPALQLVMIVLRGTLLWSGHFVLSALTYGWLGFNGELEPYLKKKSAFKSDNEKEQEAQADRSELTVSILTPMLNIIDGIIPQVPDKGSIAYLANLKAYAESPAASPNLPLAETPILLQKTSGLNLNSVEAVRKMTSDDEVIFRSRPIDPKVFLGEKISETRKFLFCKVEVQAEGKFQINEICREASFEVNSDGVELKFDEQKHNRFFYTWTSIRKAFAIDVDHEVREQQQQLVDRGQISLPLSKLWTNPMFYLRVHPFTRLVSECAIVSVLVAGGLTYLGYNPVFDNFSFGLFLALNSIVGPHIVQFIDSGFPPNPLEPAKRIERRASPVAEELTSYFLSRPPENGRKYILAAHDYDSLP